MEDPDDGARETLQAGPSRPPLWERVPVRWRRPAVVVIAFIVGAATAGGAVLWWKDEPSPTPVRGHEHAIELVLFEAAPMQRDRLVVSGALLLSGEETASVLEIGALDPSLDVRASGIPVTVSTESRYHPVDLEIRVRDCEAAADSTPIDRPFTLRWRDPRGQSHFDRAGDFDRSITRALSGFVGTACG